MWKEKEREIFWVILVLKICYVIKYFLNLKKNGKEDITITLHSSKVAIVCQNEHIIELEP